jgi:hypothetical protein
MQNQAVSTRNSSGFPGVTWHKQYEKWQSSITVNKKFSYIGLYDDPLEAALARFTVETQCPQWTCNYQSLLVKIIKIVWPEFRVPEERTL